MESENNGMTDIAV